MKKINYSFKDKKLLQKALTHSSMHEAGGGNYERLEFLGDRVLSLVIADILFKKFKNEDEGKLAKRHTALVKKEALVSIAEQINLAENIIVAESELKSSGGANNSLLADAVEALIGAVFLDSGFSASYELIENFWKEMIEAQQNPPEDAKSALQEWAQARKLPLPQYKVLSRTGSDHNPQFEVEVFVETAGAASAVAASKKLAEKGAAEALLARLKEKENGRK